MSGNKDNEVRSSKIEFIQLKQVSFSLKSHLCGLGLKFISPHESKQEGRKHPAGPDRVVSAWQSLLSVLTLPLVCDTQSPRPLFPSVQVASLSVPS